MSHHHEEKTRKECGCWLEPPYKLYCFPSVLRNGEARSRWIQALKRVNKDKSAWKPCSSDRVCSEHLVDGVPTTANPDPTLKLGYDKPVKKTRRSLFRAPSLPKQKAAACADEQEMDVDTGDIEPTNVTITNTSMFSPASSHSSIRLDHSYIATPHTATCEKCVDKTALINSLVTKVNKLSLQVKRALLGQNYFTITHISAGEK